MRAARPSPVDLHVTPPQEHGESRRVLHADGEALDLGDAPAERADVDTIADWLAHVEVPEVRTLRRVEARPTPERLARMRPVQGAKLQASKGALASLPRRSRTAFGAP